MNYKKILSLSLLCAMTLFAGSCAKDYNDEMATSDKNVSDLKQADAELWELIKTELSTLDGKIAEALGNTETEKRAAIKAKAKQWTVNMNAMIGRMEKLTDEEIRKQTQRLNEQVTAIEGKIATFEQRNNQRIAQLEQDIQEAKEQGDKSTLARLEELKKRLLDADASIDALNRQVDKWQGQLASVATKDFTATYADYKNRIEALDDIDMEKRYQNMQAMLKALTISQYEKLTHDDLNDIDGLIKRINDLYTNVYQQYDSIEEYLDSWESQIESDCSDLEMLTNDLENIDLDGVEDAFDRALEADSKLAEVNDWAESIQSYVDDIQSAVEEMNDKLAEAEELANEINDFANTEFDNTVYSEEIDSIGEQLADDMNNKLEELSDRFPHAWGGSTPSVSW